MTELVEKIAELEKRVKELENKPCKHVWKKGHNDRPALFFTMGGTGYNQCMLCGHKDYWQ